MTRERKAELILEGDDRFVTRTGTGRSMVFGDAIELDEYSPVESILASLAASQLLTMWMPAAETSRASCNVRVFAWSWDR